MFVWRLHQLKWKLMMLIIRASDQVTTNLGGRQRSRTATEWYSNPVLEVMLLSNNEPTSYGEAMVGPDSDKWLEAMKSERGSMYKTKCRLWMNYLMVVILLSKYGSLKGRQTMMVISHY